MIKDGYYWARLRDGDKLGEDEPVRVENNKILRTGSSYPYPLDYFCIGELLDHVGSHFRLRVIQRVPYTSVDADSLGDRTTPASRTIPPQGSCS